MRFKFSLLPFVVWMWDFQEIDRQRGLPNSWSHIAREKIQ